MFGLVGVFIMYSVSLLLSSLVLEVLSGLISLGLLLIWTFMVYLLVLVFLLLLH